MKLHPVTQVLYDENLLSLIYKLTGEVTILDVNKQINTCKKRILIINLDRIKSFQYYNDGVYRNIINNLVENTRKQLSIYLDFYYCPPNTKMNVSNNGLINLQNFRFELHRNQHNFYR